MKKFFTEPTMSVSCFDVEHVITSSGVEGTGTEQTQDDLQNAGYTVYKTSLADLNIVF